MTTGSNGQPISDVSYTISPTISLDQTRSRLHWVFTYSPGFTFYQKTSSLNQANQNLGVNLSYRLSPHVTLSLRDTFQQTSNVLNQPNTDLQQPVSGGVFVPNYSVIAPIAEVLTNTANATLTYQFAANAMVGASGTFANLYYPNQSQVPGLANSSSKGVRRSIRTACQRCTISAPPINTRVSGQCDWGAERNSRTASSVFILSTSSRQFPFPSSAVRNTPARSSSGCLHQAWSPGGGVSFGWQGKLTSFAASYSQTINEGGGLGGAVQSTSANASLRRQLTRKLSTSSEPVIRTIVFWMRRPRLTPVDIQSRETHRCSAR